MTPIYGISDQVRLPRLGKIRLGIKKKTRGGVEYPFATEYFIVPSEIVPYLEKLGVENPDQPTSLPVQIPVEDDDIWASQYYKCYSGSRGLTCKGDGKTCNRMIDVNTGLKAGKDAVSVTWKNEVCAGQDCQYVKDRQCKPTLNLQFIMPDVPGLGVWQIDSHFMSIRNINSDALLLRKVYGRISFIPLYLTLEPEETVTEGKKKTVRTLHLRIRGTMREALLEASKAVTQLLLPPPDEKEEPIDDDIIEGELATEPDPQEKPAVPGPTKVTASAADSSSTGAGGTPPPPTAAETDYPHILRVFGVRDMLTACWGHGDCWVKDKDGRPEHATDLQRLCRWVDQMKPLISDACAKQTPPLLSSDLNAKLKADPKYGDIWGKITAKQQCDVLEDLCSKIAVNPVQEELPF